MAIINRKGNTVHFNLTPVFVLWTVLALVLWLLSGMQFEAFLWLAAAPWIIWGVFVLLAIILGLTVALAVWWRGGPLTLNWGNKSKVVQRKR